KMWSAIHRVDRSIFEESDTNMLIEAWHHVLKGKFLKGKRNRCFDHLLHVLTEEVIPYYLMKQTHQDLGFEGDDLEVKKRKQVLATSRKQYSLDDIKV
ncbi:hypothetical protein BT96DRAFT_796534, partial [Gymnopus androsaceus JB14]